MIPCSGMPETEANGHIEVPSDGWYSFFFGTKDDAGSEYSLRIKSDDDEVSIRLPLQHEARILSDFNIGRV